LRGGIEVKATRRAEVIGSLLFSLLTTWCSSTLAGDVGATPGSTVAHVPNLPRVPIDADIDRLPGNERAALANIVAAARVIDAAAMHYAFAGSFSTLVRLAEDRSDIGRARLDGFVARMSPWLDDGSTFVPGVLLTAPAQPGYPADATKDEVANWWARLPDSDRALAKSHYSVVRRQADGSLYAVRYSVAYGDEFAYAANLLNAAARLTAEPTLKRYLVSRAKSLLTDDYHNSYVDFVELSGIIDVVLGPEESGDDWFGVKFPFETGIGLVNDAATQRVRRFVPHLQNLEDNLPLSEALRGRPLGKSGTIVVLDAVYQGQSGGTWIGYGLPDDAQVTREHGRRTGLYLNLLAARYKRLHHPIAEAILQRTDAGALRLEDIADEIAMVRLFDALGPQTLTTGQPLSEALQDTTETAQQIQSMLLSLWAHQYLIDQGKLQRSEGTTLYSAFLVPALARAGGGLGSSAARGSTYILNCLLEAQAFHLDKSGRVLIDPTRARDTITKTIRDFVPLIAAGNVGAIRTRLSRYAVISPELQRILNRIEPRDANFVPVFVSAARLEGG
jgi:hypothetical protein